MEDNFRLILGICGSSRILLSTLRPTYISYNHQLELRVAKQSIPSEYPFPAWESSSVTSLMALVALEILMVPELLCWPKDLSTALKGGARGSS